MTMVGICGFCESVQGYHHANMLRMSDYPEIDWLSKPDVYAGQTWFCQGCGSGTKFEIPLSKAKELSE